MKNRLIIIGVGGHGRVIADIALKTGYTDICFVDDHVTGECMGFPVIGMCNRLTELDDGHTDFLIGIGSNETRKKISEAYDVNWTTLVHPSAQIAVCVSIGVGTAVMAGAIINTCANIGRHCIINSGAVVEHDNVLEDYVHVSPQAALGGTVHVGALSHIGIGAVVKNNTNICAGCTIGVGAAVTRDIKQSGTFVGVPARKIK